MAAAAPWAGIIDATAGTDAARRTELVTWTWRDAYAGRLAASDFELGCQVIAGHVHQMLATVTARTADSSRRPRIPTWCGSRTTSRQKLR
jgi:hypothetical protein